MKEEASLKMLWNYMVDDKSYNFTNKTKTILIKRIKILEREILNVNMQRNNILKKK